MPGPILVLGPQRPTPNLPGALDALGRSGTVGLITAGWRYDEAEIGALQGALSRDTQHLPLYAWFEEICDAVPALKAAWRARQERVLRAKRLYRVRLSLAYETVLRLNARPVEDPDLHQDALLDAVRVVRELDARAQVVADRIRSEADVLAQARALPLVQARLSELDHALAGVDTLAMAGGHVAILLNRLEFFGMGGRLRALLERGGCVAAWSAGAMVLGPRVVLFYDDPPEGPAEPVVLDPGLGLLPELTFFPHAGRRLRLDQPARMRLLAARFGRCLGLEPGAALVIQDGTETDHSAPGSLLELSQGVQP